MPKVFDAFDGSERDIDSVMPQQEINQRTRRALPALDLVLAHAVNEVVLLGRGELSKPFAVDGLAALLNGSKRSTINVYERRTHARDARHEQTIPRRYTELIVHEIRDPRFACARKQSVAHCLQRFDFVEASAPSSARPAPVPRLGSAKPRRPQW